MSPESAQHNSGDKLEGRFGRNDLNNNKTKIPNGSTNRPMTFAYFTSYNLDCCMSCIFTILELNKL
jgi:hypothetical protein